MTETFISINTFASSARTSILPIYISFSLILFKIQLFEKISLHLYCFPPILRKIDRKKTISQIIWNWFQNEEEKKSKKKRLKAIQKVNIKRNIIFFFLTHFCISYLSVFFSTILFLLCSNKFRWKPILSDSKLVLFEEKLTIAWNTIHSLTETEFNVFYRRKQNMKYISWVLCLFTVIF